MVGKVSAKTLHPVHQGIMPSGVGNGGSRREMSWEPSSRVTEIHTLECGQPPSPSWGNW